MGVQCLARSLKAAAARFPLLVIYTPDTLSPSAVAALRREGCQLVPVQRYVPPGAQNRRPLAAHLLSLGCDQNWMLKPQPLERERCQVRAGRAAWVRVGTLEADADARP